MEAPMKPLGPDARALIDAANDADGPSLDDAARVRAKLAVRVAAATATATLATKSAAAATATKSAAAGTSAGALGGGTGATGIGAGLFGAGTKVVLAVSLVGGAATAGAVALHRDEARVTSARPTESATTAPAHPKALVGSPAAPASPKSSAAPSAAATPSDSATAENEREAAPAVPASATAHNVARVAPPPATPPVVSNVSSASAASSTKAPAPSALESVNGESVPVAISSSAPSPPTSDTIAEEAVLIRAAQAALEHGDGSTALARLDEHQARFSTGVLREEREAARVFALCASGRSTEARAAAARFAAASPRSPLAAQVRRSCTTSPSTAPQ
jgi:hypothetical protein